MHCPRYMHDILPLERTLHFHHASTTMLAKYIRTMCTVLLNALYCMSADGAFQLVQKRDDFDFYSQVWQKLSLQERGKIDFQRLNSFPIVLPLNPPKDTFWLDNQGRYSITANKFRNYKH